MNFIHLNKGSAWVFGSAVICACILSNFYDGKNDALIITQTISYTCACLELSKNFKPRMNNVFPIIFLIIPIGGYITVKEKGIVGLLVYLTTLIAIYGIAKRVDRKREPVAVVNASAVAKPSENHLHN